MEKKVRKQAFRHLVQAMFFALTNGYTQGFIEGKIYKGRNKKLCVPGLNCYSCPGALNACPIGSLQAVLNSRQFTVSCYVFGFIMMVGALMGRFVCGWLCPFGLVQDLLYKIPIFKKIKNLPKHKYLTKLKFVILLVFVFLLPALIKDITGLGQPWFCEYICPSGTLIAGIPLVALNSGLRAAIGMKFMWKVFILVLILLLAVKVYRPFCKYLCPLGALYGLCNPISLYRYQVDQDSCVKCGACQKACDMDIKVWETPNNMECIRCGKCRDACPTGAIGTSFGSVKDKWAKKNVKQLQTKENAPKSKTGTEIFQMIMGCVLACGNLLLFGIQLLATIGFLRADESFIGKTFFSAMVYFLPNMIGICCVIVAFCAAILIVADKGDGVRTLAAYWIQKHVVVILLINIILAVLRMDTYTLAFGTIVMIGEVIILILMKLLSLKTSKNVEASLT